MKPVAIVRTPDPPKTNGENDQGLPLPSIPKRAQFLAQVLNAGLELVRRTYLTAEMLPVAIITVVGDEIESWLGGREFSLSRVANRSPLIAEVRSYAGGEELIGGQEKDYTDHILQNPYLQACACLSSLGTVPATGDATSIRRARNEASRFVAEFFSWVKHDRVDVPEKDRARFSELANRLDDQRLRAAKRLTGDTLAVPQENRAARIRQCMEEAPFFFRTEILLSCITPNVIGFCGECGRFHPIEQMRYGGMCSACDESFRREVLAQDDGFDGNYSGTDWED